jgi:hypothetical protein
VGEEGEQVWGSKYFDALLCVCVLGLARCGPVFIFGFTVYYEAREGV